MKYSFSILILVISFLGCNENSSTITPTLSGSIAGKSTLYTDDGQPLQDNNGIKISIDGSSYSTTSSFDGSWKLKGIPVGIYTIVFSKKGFATLKQYSFQFVGGDTVTYVQSKIGQIPNVTITNLELIQQDVEKYTIQFSISRLHNL